MWRYYCTNTPTPAFVQLTQCDRDGGRERYGMPLTAVDLFAGGGGLTVGLKRAGFEVVAAVELDKHACATYRANHGEVNLLEEDIKAVPGKVLRELAGGNGVDLLAGCPPCQGFTSLNKGGEKDPRNWLVLEMCRLSEEIMPKAIMMENVPGLTTKGKVLYQQLRTRLESLGYVLTDSVDILEAADYGVPQRRRRLVLLAGHGFKIGLPPATHSQHEKKGLHQWKCVRDAIGNLDELGDPITTSEASKMSNMQDSKWHVVRQLSELNIKRIRAAKSGKSWDSIPEVLRPRCHQGAYRGFPNVYGRMEWEQPSPTITGGCTTFSKGRFGHPVEDRTISVREAALLQTFPMDYVFDIPYMEYVCSVIGNALPCDFAEVLAKKCHAAILKSSTTQC